MSKFERYTGRENAPVVEKPKIHPIWRGIGCLMLIIVPVMSYAGAQVFIEAVPGFSWFPFPRSGEIYRNIDLQYLVLPFSIAEMIFTLIFMVMGFVIVTFFYSLIYRIAGPPKYGPTDAPPPRVKRTRRRR